MTNVDAIEMEARAFAMEIQREAATIEHVFSAAPGSISLRQSAKIIVGLCDSLARLQAKLDASENVPMAVFDDCLEVIRDICFSSSPSPSPAAFSAAKRVLEWNAACPREKGTTDG